MDGLNVSEGTRCEPSLQCTVSHSVSDIRSKKSATLQGVAITRIYFQPGTNTGRGGEVLGRHCVSHIIGRETTGLQRAEIDVDHDLAGC